MALQCSRKNTYDLGGGTVAEGSQDFQGTIPGRLSIAAIKRFPAEKSQVTGAGYPDSSQAKSFYLPD